MREVLNIRRTAILWWGIATALVLLIPSAWLKGVATYIRTASWLKPDQPPLLWISNVSSWIDSVTSSGTKQVKFDPQQALIYIGPYGIANLLVAIVFGAVLLGVAFVLYRKSAASSGILDDLLAMIILYVVLRIEGGAARSLNLPIMDFFNSEEPFSYLVVLTAYMILLLIRGRASTDPRVFFKILLEGVIIWLIVVPVQTVEAIAVAIEFPAIIHETLVTTSPLQTYFPMILTTWAMLGVVLAATSLYKAGRVPQAERTFRSELEGIRNRIERHTGRSAESR